MSVLPEFIGWLVGVVARQALVDRPPGLDDFADALGSGVAIGVTSTLKDRESKRVVPAPVGVTAGSKPRASKPVAPPAKPLAGAKSRASKPLPQVTEQENPIFRDLMNQLEAARLELESAPKPYDTSFLFPPEDFPAPKLTHRRPKKRRS
jgi:hypothetical protein